MWVADYTPKAEIEPPKKEEIWNKTQHHRTEIQTSLERVWLRSRGQRSSLRFMSPGVTGNLPCQARGREAGWEGGGVESHHLEPISGTGTMGNLPLGVREDCPEGVPCTTGRPTHGRSWERTHTGARMKSPFLLQGPSSAPADKAVYHASYRGKSN